MFFIFFIVLIALSISVNDVKTTVLIGARLFRHCIERLFKRLIPLIGEENLNKIEFIKCMRSVNMPISKLKTYMNLYAQGPSTLDSRKEILENQLDAINIQLDDLKKAKERLIKKIEIYNQEQIKRDKEK